MAYTNMKWHIFCAKTNITLEETSNYLKVYI